MLITHFLGFLLASLALIKSTSYCVKFLTKIAHILKFSEFLVSFVIIGIISSLPEASISIISAFSNKPEIGFGTLIGSNIADLSLILGLVILVGGNLKIKSRTVLHDFRHIVLALLPFVLAYDQELTRGDGILLIFGCLFFFRHLIRQKYNVPHARRTFVNESLWKNAINFLASILALFASALFAVRFAESLAIDLQLPLLTISLILVALGTCLPELFFALKSLKMRHAELALGDILGNVIIDATLILGIVAFIAPIKLAYSVVVLTGIFSILTVGITLSIIHYRKQLTQHDGILMIFLYIVFVFVEMAFRTAA